MPILVVLLSSLLWLFIVYMLLTKRKTHRGGWFLFDNTSVTKTVQNLG